MKTMKTLMTKSKILLVLLGIAAATALVSLRAEDAPPAATQSAPVPLTDQDLAAIKGPDTAVIAEKGDPGAEMTGTANDVTMADPKKGVTLADLANQAG